ncbi:MAG: superoxide dismutase [Oscillospiraceae bacterium]|nr:superoxide dismutase [Oscillospiraceae bacterium]
MNCDKYYPYTAVPLPYALGALDPHISEYTMYFHHEKHYMTYLEKLNAALKDSPLMQNVPLECLTKMDCADIRVNAGGVYNHELYFASLSPNCKGPSNHMKEKIKECFGSQEELENKLVQTGMGLVGSGWVWLAMTREKHLVILTTCNQDTIDLDRLAPLLIIDVWEHAYYLDRQNRREEYLKAVMKCLNWANAESLMKE